MATPAINKLADRIFFSESKPCFSSRPGAFDATTGIISTRSTGRPRLSTSEMASVSFDLDFINTFISGIGTNKTGYLRNVPRASIESKAVLIFHMLSPLKPSSLNIQASSESSFIFTFKKGANMAYLEYFFNIKGEMDEALITAFNGDDMTISFSGSLNDAFNEFYKNYDPITININKPKPKSKEVYVLSDYTATESELETYQMLA